jgi:hypothetical protein
MDNFELTRILYLPLSTADSHATIFASATFTIK